MSDIINSLYNTQEDVLDSQCNSLDFLQSQSSFYDLNRYVKENASNVNNLEMIQEDVSKENDEFEFLGNGVGLDDNYPTQTQNLDMNFNSNISNNLIKNISNIKHDEINFNPVANKNTLNNINNNANNTINSTNNNQGNRYPKESEKQKKIIDMSRSNIFDEKIFLLTQEIDEIEKSQKDDFNNNNKKQDNLIQNNAFENIKNEQKNKDNNLNIATTSMIASNNKNIHTEKNFKMNSKTENCTFKNLANNDTDKKISNSRQKLHLQQENTISNIAINSNSSDPYTDEIFEKIQNSTEIFINEYEILSNKLHSTLENYKVKFFKDTNLIYKILKEDTKKTISDEEKNRMIDQKIKILLSEMIGLLTEFSHP